MRSVKVDNKDPVSFDNPSRLTPNNVMFWEKDSKALILAKQQGDKHASPLLFKAKKFLQNGCVIQDSETKFLIKPIKDYNKTTYTVLSTDKDFSCNCQGFNKKLKDFSEGKSEITPICSHILAVKQYCLIKSVNQDDAS